VWFEKLPNPFDFWRGMAPLSAATAAASTDYAGSLHMKGIMENNGESGPALRSDEQREQILAALRDRKRGPGTADRPVFLWGGAEMVTPKLSSSDLQFLENRKFSRGEICAAFGVPEEIITATEHAKYDVMAGARLNCIENRVVPLCRRLEAEEDVVVKSIDPKADGWYAKDDAGGGRESRKRKVVNRGQKNAKVRERSHPPVTRFVSERIGWLRFAAPSGRLLHACHGASLTTSTSSPLGSNRQR